MDASISSQIIVAALVGLLVGSIIRCFTRSRYPDPIRKAIFLAMSFLIGFLFGIVGGATTIVGYLLMHYWLRGAGRRENEYEGIVPADGDGGLDSGVMRQGTEQGTQKGDIQLGTIT